MPLSKSYLRFLFLSICALALCLGVTGSASGSAPQIGQLAQAGDIQFEHIQVGSMPNGRPVYSILQGRRGFLWVGTADGLYRYDGYGFAYFPIPQDELAPANSGQALALAESADGLLWVGSSGGLLSFDRQSQTFTPYEALASSRYDELHAWEIWEIYEDRAGMLWAGTERGLEVVDRQDKTNSLYHPYMKDKPVRAILEGPEGALWIGTAYGLDRLDSERRVFSHIQYYPTGLGNLALGSIRALFFDQAGILWIGTDAGLARYDPASGESRWFDNDRDNPNSLGGREVRAIGADEWGALWLGTADGGLSRFDPLNETFRQYRHNPDDPFSPSEGALAALFFDREGLMWVGGDAGYLDKTATVGQGFSLYQKNDSSSNSLSANSIQAVYEDGAGLLWLGSDSGLDRIERSSGQVSHFRRASNDQPGLSANSVQALYGDANGIIWIGTVQGLDRLDPATSVFKHYDSRSAPNLSDDFITRIYPDSAGALWIGTTNGGLNRLDPRSDQIRHYVHDPNDPTSLSDNTVKAIHQDRQGDLWVGTNKGLNRLERGDNAFERYLHDPNNPDTLSSNFILSVHQDRQGNLWVGTYLGGLNKLDRQYGRFSAYHVKDGLAGDIVYGILEDDLGRLWLSTNNGVSRFDPIEKTFTHFTMIDGLQGSDFNSGAYFKSRTGEMFFGGPGGLNAFYPRNFRQNELPPTVVLLALRQEGELLPIDGAYDSLQTITLAWPNNSFEFEFAALSYSDPLANQYAYRLEGFDDWQQIGAQRSGSYEGLPAGSYRLQMIGSNNKGEWSEDGAWLSVIVEPPFWQKGWFLFGAALVLLAAGFGVYRVRLRGVRQRQRLLEAQVAARTVELEQEMAERQKAEAALAQETAKRAVLAERSRLAQDLHDAVSQSLYSANLMAETLPRLWELDPQKAQHQLNDLQGLTRGALAEMRAMLLEMRPENLVQMEMVELLEQLALAVSGRLGIKVTVLADEKHELPTDVKIAFYRIAQEALNNSARHAQAGQVRIIYTAALDRASLRISDDGRGFDINKIPPGSLGIEIMSERAAAIGAELVINSQPDVGAEVSLDWRAGEG